MSLAQLQPQLVSDIVFELNPKRKAELDSFKFYFLTFARVYSQQNLIHVHHNLYKVEGRYSWLVLATPHRYRTFYQKKFSFDTQQRFCWINLIIWENIFSRTGLLRDRSQYRLSTIQYNFMLITHQEKIGAH